jgi:hypothetical protein
MLVYCIFGAMLGKSRRAGLGGTMRGEELNVQRYPLGGP